MKISLKLGGHYPLIFLGYFLFCLYHSAPAQSLIESQLPKGMQEVIAKAGHDTLKINIFLDSATHIQQSAPVQALTYCFAALQKAREVSSDHHIDQALLKIGKILFHAGAYQEAMDYYQEYQKRALTSGNVLNQLKIRHNIIALKLGVNDKFDAAVYDEMKALLNDYDKLWRESSDTVIVREMIPGLLVNLSNLALLNNTFKDADIFLTRGIELNSEYQILPTTLLQVYLMKFLLSSKTGKFEEAFSQAARLRELCIQANNLVMLATLEFYMGNAFSEKGDWEGAIQSYESAFYQGQKLNNLSIVTESANKLQEIYQQRGNLEATLKYTQAAQAARNSMKKIGAASQVAESEMLARFHALEKEMAMEQRSRTIRFVLALVLSFASAIGVFILFFRTRKKYRLANKEKEAYALETSKTIVEKEALSTALETKEKQLTTEVMYRVQKNEIIKEVIHKLHDAQRQYKKDAQKEMTEAIKGLERAIDTDSWEDFELRFLQVHQGFYDRLQELIPKLTTNERRLCAFLKLGMSSKEISTLTGQSTDSIIKARHRLRKKLGLPDQETSLIEFFADF